MEPSVPGAASIGEPIAIIFSLVLFRLEILLLWN